MQACCDRRRARATRGSACAGSPARASRSAGVFLERLVERRPPRRGAGLRRRRRAGSSRSATATARCSAATRRWSRRRPRPGLPDDVRAQTRRGGTRALRASVGYRSAGTVEFVYDAGRAEASFLEVNTRLQVEHPVTEEMFGIDLVEWMLRLAQGDTGVVDDPARARVGARRRGPGLRRGPRPRPPARAPGLLTARRAARPACASTPGSRPGTEVTTHYDPLLAKVIAHGADRDERARRALAEALAGTRIDGIETNLGLLRAVAARRRGAPAAALTPRTLDAIARRRAAHRGRCARHAHHRAGLARPLGLWHVGVPPSGPMDDLSFRLGNRALGNPEGAPGLECTLTGPDAALHPPTHGLRHRRTGAGHRRRRGRPAVGAGRRPRRRRARRRHGRRPRPAHLRAGRGRPRRARRTSAARRRSTSAASAGTAAARCAPGDVLRVGDADVAAARSRRAAGRAARVRDATGRSAALEGPHAAPEFFTADDIDDLLRRRRGRCTSTPPAPACGSSGPSPRWARTDGGEAGLHPSNIHDTPYAVGAVDFTGDMPILLGPDGPSLGGFVCPATVVERRAVEARPAPPRRHGALRAGQRRRRPTRCAPPRAPARPPTATPSSTAACSRRLPERRGAPAVTLPPQRRRQPARRVRRAWRSTSPRGCACTRSWRRSRRASSGELPRHRRPHPRHPLAAGARRPRRAAASRRSLDLSCELEDELPATDDLRRPEPDRAPAAVAGTTRRRARRSSRYMAGVRDDAPWCPWNIEFIRRINGLDSRRRRVPHRLRRRVPRARARRRLPRRAGRDAARPAAPARDDEVQPGPHLDAGERRRHRRRLPVHLRHGGPRRLPVRRPHRPGVVDVAPARRRSSRAVPWLLRFFDRINWYPVERRGAARAARRHGRRPPADPHRGGRRSRLADHERFLAENAESIAAFRAAQAAAFAAERDAWEAAGEFDRVDAEPEPPRRPPTSSVPDGCEAVEAPVRRERLSASTSAWATSCVAGQTLLALEAMKMEAPVAAPVAGRVVEVVDRARRAGRAGHRAGRSSRRRRRHDRHALRASRGPTSPSDIGSRRGRPARGLDRPCATRRAVAAELEAVCLRAEAGDRLPLAGCSLAVKDNIDVAGCDTTAGCPAFAYRPERDATAVARLRAAGAVVVGKTNLDQFATGLVGTRSPYGAVRDATDPEPHLGRVELGLGGGGGARRRRPRARHRHRRVGPGARRVPRHRRREADEGPGACDRRRAGVPHPRVRDRVSQDLALAELAVRVMAGPDDGDPLSREAPPSDARRSALRRGSACRRPRPARRARARAGRRRSGPTPGGTPMRAPSSWRSTSRRSSRPRGCSTTARSSPSATPRSASSSMRTPTRSIRRSAASFVARGTSRPGGSSPTRSSSMPPARQRRRVRGARRAPPADDRRASDARGGRGRPGRRERGARQVHELREPPRPRGARVPAGEVDGLPFGVQLVGAAFSDGRLAELAEEGAMSDVLARRGGRAPERAAAEPSAHLPRRALDRSTTTASRYRLYALDTEPPKPGVVRVASGGAALEVEVWRLSAAAFGDFVARAAPADGDRPRRARRRELRERIPRRTDRTRGRGRHHRVRRLARVPRGLRRTAAAQSTMRVSRKTGMCRSVFVW